MTSSLPLGTLTGKTMQVEAGNRRELLPRLLALLLVIFLAGSAAELTWKCVEFWPGGAKTGKYTAAPATPSGESRPANLGSAYETLASLQLFGRPAKNQESPSAAESATHPPTTLNISLLGVIYLSRSQKSVAIIAEKGNKASENIYGVGDQLPGNATISEIRPDRVVLQRGGRLETLLLEESAPAGATPGTPASPEKAASVTSQVKIDRQHWEQQLGNLAGLANEIGVEVYPPGSTQQGYRLKGKSDSKVLSELGLQNGDVLLEINGTTLQNAGNAFQAFEKLKKAEAITLQIIRDGRRQTKLYTIGQFKTAL